MAPTSKKTDSQATPAGKDARSKRGARRKAIADAHGANASTGRTREKEPGRAREQKRASVLAEPHRRLARGSGAADEAIEVSSTEAQNNFGLLLDRVARNQPVFIKRRQNRQAVILSIERYEALTRAQESPALDTLTAEFDALYDRMQGAESRSASESLFSATPDELARAATDAARRRAR
jgi:antitoxin Phd